MSKFKQGQIVRIVFVDSGLVLDRVGPIDKIEGNYVTVDHKRVHVNNCYPAEPDDMYPYNLPADAFYSEMRRGVIDCCGRSTSPKWRYAPRFGLINSPKRVTRRRCRRERKSGIVKGPIMDRVRGR